MKIALQQLMANLQKQLLPAYWVSGDEPLLQQEACDLLRNYCKRQGFENKIVFHIEAGFDWNDFLAETQSLSLFSEKTLIELRLNNKKLPEAGRKLLAEYLQQPSEDKVILLIGEKIDTATQKTKWFKAIGQYTGFVQIWPLSLNDLHSWIVARLKKYKLNADKEVIKLLAERGEGNLLALSQDIEKLNLLFPNSHLNLEQAMAAISDNSRYDVFTLVDAALVANTQRTLKVLQGLKAEGVEPILILWALVREIRLLFNLANSGEAVSEALLRKNGVWPKRMGLIKSALNRGSVNLYQRLLQQCSHLDEMVKGMRAGNSWDGLERVSLNLAGVRL